MDYKTILLVVLVLVPIILLIFGVVKKEEALIRISITLIMLLLINTILNWIFG
ncbi:Uncharacterised protein [Streptococcus equi subsp. equi]|nr:Uncharacterised protein [Streptococcus equi subsp. equi]